MNKHERLEKAAYEMYHALRAILKSRKNFNHLYMNDPRTLNKCGVAVNIYENRNNRVWMETAYHNWPADKPLA